MIDKARSEKAAILEGTAFRLCTLSSSLHKPLTVFPGAIIRVCQFHIIQAIRRWVRDHFLPQRQKKGKPTVKLKRASPSLPTAAMAQLLDAFRAAQRCRVEADWPRHRNIFEQNVRTICAAAELASRAASIIQYFRDNWWCAEWRGMHSLCTSIYQHTFCF